MKTLTKLFVIAFLSSFLSACVNPPKKPVGHIGALNAMSATPYVLTFNLETDFTADLKLKPGVKGVRRNVTLADLNKNWVLDAGSKEELTRYALQWKERAALAYKQLDECRAGR